MLTLPSLQIVILLTYLQHVLADSDYSLISPYAMPGFDSRDLQNRRKPDFGGKQGLAKGADLAKHKNTIKNIGVQFFTQDPLAVFHQDSSWKESYAYDASVGYYWFGKNRQGLGTMNILIKEYPENNQTCITG
jgi:hypothetical protein